MLDDLNPLNGARSWAPLATDVRGNLQSARSRAMVLTDRVSASTGRRCSVPAVSPVVAAVAPVVAAVLAPVAPTMHAVRDDSHGRYGGGSAGHRRGADHGRPSHPSGC